jgi:hypothetical protein
MDKGIRIPENEQVALDELLLLRDPPLSKYNRRFSIRDNFNTPVSCHDILGHYISLFVTVKDAAKAARVDAVDILDCCYGLIPSLQDKIWKLSDSCHGSANQLSIDCMALNGEVIHRFGNLSEASSALRIPCEEILRCCAEMNSNVEGLRFCYTISKDLRLEKVTCLPRNVMTRVLDLDGEVIENACIKSKSPGKLSDRTDRSTMTAEGWLFNKEDSKLIGREARRFFAFAAASDGVIQAYLPVSGLNVEERWRLRYSDGDSEDVLLPDLLRYIRYKRDDLDEVPEDDRYTSREKVPLPVQGSDLQQASSSGADLLSVAPNFLKQSSATLNS